MLSKLIPHIEFVAAGLLAMLSFVLFIRAAETMSARDPTTLLDHLPRGWRACAVRALAACVALALAGFLFWLSMR